MSRAPSHITHKLHDTHGVLRSSSLPHSQYLSSHIVSQSHISEWPMLGYAAPCSLPHRHLISDLCLLRLLLLQLVLRHLPLSDQDTQTWASPTRLLCAPHTPALLPHHLCLPIIAWQPCDFQAVHSARKSPVAHSLTVAIASVCQSLLLAVKPDGFVRTMTVSAESDRQPLCEGMGCV